MSGGCRGGALVPAPLGRLTGSFAVLLTGKDKMMKQPLLFSAILMGSMAVVVAPEPARAIALVTGVQLNPSSSGVEVVLEISDGDRDRRFSEIFTVNLGKTLTVEVKNLQLRLPESNTFYKENPVPGIASVTVMPGSPNNILILVSGTDSVPVSQISRQDSKGIALSFQASTNSEGGTAEIPDTAIQPDSKVTVNGREVIPPNSGTSPLLSGQVELSVGETTVPLNSPPTVPIRLGTTTTINRLQLRDVPVEDVLNLLGNTVDLKVVFREEPRSQNRAMAERRKAKISLDIENEQVENILNYVLQFSGLQGVRVGSTIVVSLIAPVEKVESETISRSISTNKIPASQAAAYLFSLGVERPSTSPLSAAEALCFSKKDSLPPWAGLQAIADDTKNVLTLSGSRTLVESAIEKLRNLSNCQPAMPPKNTP